MFNGNLVLKKNGEDFILKSWFANCKLLSTCFFLFFHFLLLFSFAADPELEQNLPLLSVRSGEYLTDSDKKDPLDYSLLLSFSCFFSSSFICSSER